MTRKPANPFLSIFTASDVARRVLGKAAALQQRGAGACEIGFLNDDSEFVQVVAGPTWDDAILALTTNQGAARRKFKPAWGRRPWAIGQSLSPSRGSSCSASTKGGQV